MEVDNGGKNNNDRTVRKNFLKVPIYVNLKENVIQPAQHFAPS